MQRKGKEVGKCTRQCCHFFFENDFPDFSQVFQTNFSNFPNYFQKFPKSVIILRDLHMLNKEKRLDRASENVHSSVVTFSENNFPSVFQTDFINFPGLFSKIFY